MNPELISKLSAITEEEKAILAGQKEIDPHLYMDSRGVVQAGKFLEDGQLIKIRTHTRFIHFPSHSHDYLEMVYMCQGSTTHRINGETVELKQGELLFLNPRSTQEILPAGKNDIAINFIIRPEFFATTMTMINEEKTPLRDFLMNSFSMSGNDPHYMHFAVNDVVPIQNLIENLVWTLLNEQNNKRSTNQITMGLLFLQLINFSEHLTFGKQNDQQRLTLSIYRYIEAHYRDGDLTSLAEKELYDIFAMSRLIKQLTGKTYTQLVQTKRLTQAAFLLKNTSMPVSEVGHEVGYENLSYFHRLFTKTYRLRPKQYRDQR